ncbi:MAG: hypothetical protein J6Y37_10495 [Paludibacteraceae bacterium]|nr:hypothetical protein [Paludibacteraceae bacterium]
MSQDVGFASTVRLKAFPSSNRLHRRCCRMAAKTGRRLEVCTFSKTVASRHS